MGCHRVAVHVPQFYADIARQKWSQKNRPASWSRQAGDVMLGRLPILLIVLSTLLAVTGAHAEGFFEQVLSSFLKASAKTEPVVETAAATEESEPLALQPTTATTRLSTRKRYQSSRRHRQAAPAQRSHANGEPAAAASERRPAEPPAQDSSVPREPVNNSKEAEQVLPSADADNALAPAAAWPDPAPPATLAPWPVEQSHADAALAEPPRGAAQNEPQNDVRSAAQQPWVDEREEVEPDSFLEPQRLLLGFIAAAWLTLGLLMFAFRRPLTRVLGYRRRRARQQGANRIPDAEFRQPLALIAARDGASRPSPSPPVFAESARR